MVETPAPGKELRYRNVSLHMQGKPEHGTLHLLKHHLCFSYQPGAKKGDQSGGHSRNVSESHPSEATNGAKDVRNEQSAPKSEATKARPKEVWIPYPMISFCALKPSHASSMAARADAPNDLATASQTGEDLFPPTFGTSGYERPSTDSARLAAYATPPRPSSPPQGFEQRPAPESARQPVIRLRRKDFGMMALHFNSGEFDMSSDETARQAFYVLRKRCCVSRVEDLHAFDYRPPKEEARSGLYYDARREFARMGISPKAADGPGAAWRITDINQDYSYSWTYPSVLCVPKAVSDNTLKYGGTFRSKSRIPCLSYLHSNGGSITRASQPMVGVQNKRNPQDERLVSAIFSSHSPPLHTAGDSPPQEPASDASNLEPRDDSAAVPSSRSETALDQKPDEQPPVPRIYGSTRQNVIADARPLANAMLNRVTGGGIEDVSKYMGSRQVPVEKEFLNIANIHVMRKSLEKVIESFGSADYVNMKPNAEILRKSGWLGHIACLLEGSEMVARVVGLGGSHVLVHCSDGWDRTAQVAALAQVMLDPHYRTMTGFISLIQKDFLSFGHKFRDRGGIEGSEKWFSIENERVVPSQTRENSNGESRGLNAMGHKAFSGAKKWIEKNRGSLFNNQQPGNRAGSSEPGSRSSSPPPNPLIHSPPSSTSKEEKDGRMKPDEVSPVFHQFLDTVFQLLNQQPDAFEFNERFLKRLFYHCYSCQYGDFIFNNERERSEHRLPSVWGYFLSQKQQFTNPSYVAKLNDPLLFPRRHGREREVEVRWWASLFGRKDEDMNLPRALAPADPPTNPAALRPSVSFEEPSGRESSAAGTEAGDGMIKETKSTPSLAAMRDSLTNSFSSMTFRAPPEARKESAPEISSKQPEPSDAVEPGRTEDSGRSDEQQRPEEAAASSIMQGTGKLSQMDMDEGDPLGVSSSAAKPVRGGGLDFAAFASQNAYSER